MKTFTFNTNLKEWFEIQWRAPSFLVRTTMREHSDSALEAHLVHTSTALHGLRSRRGDVRAHLRGGSTGVAKSMIRSLRSRWRCFKHTGWAHETDLHSGACRYCGTRTGERL